MEKKMEVSEKNAVPKLHVVAKDRDRVYLCMKLKQILNLWEQFKLHQGMMG